jgi:hypothetical protein
MAAPTRKYTEDKSLEKVERFPRKKSTSEIFFLNRDLNCGKKYKGQY